MKELLPLPKLHVEQRMSSTLSRGVRQRIGRRIAIQERSNETIAALNWLSGTVAETRPRHPTEAQKKAHEFILSRVEASPASLPFVEAEATAR
eukprot:4300776-Amphidinium_carterae.2